MKGVYRLVPGGLAVVFLLAPAAHADLIVLQQDLNGYTGVADTWTGSFDSYYNYGSATELRGFSDLAEGRFKVLVRFGDLNAAIGVADKSLITSATLMLYKCYGQTGYAYDNVTAYRVLRPWAEGTGRGPGPDNTKPIDGASLHYWGPATPVTSGWSKLDGYDNVYELDVTGQTIDHFQYNFAIYATNWSPRSSIQEVEDNLNSFYQDGDTLYFSTTRWDLGGSYGFSYYVPADRWDGTSCTGDADVDKAAPQVGDWPDETAVGFGSIDVTEWVRAWFDDPGSNFGVLLTAGGKEVGFWSSEHNAGTAEEPDYTLGPKLVVEYVPAPAAMVLLAAGAPWLLRRRRAGRGWRREADVDA